MLFIHKKDEKGMKKIYSPFTIPLVPYCNNTHVLYDILADIAKGFAINFFSLERWSMMNDAELSLLPIIAK